MGHYTQLKCKIKLRKDTPENVLSALQRILIVGDCTTIQELNHEFWKCPRWFMLFHGVDFEDIQGGKMHLENGYWVIDLHTQFKNYDSEIDKFINWITPFVVGRKKKEYVGWFKPEEMDRFNIYIERGTQAEIRT